MTEIDPQNAGRKLRELNGLLASHSPFVLAFSGGVDSRFIAHTAWRAKVKFTAVHIRGPHVPHSETEFALAWLGKKMIPFVETAFDPLGIAAVAEGSKQRCYVCKREIFSCIAALAKGNSILEGSNASDLEKFRPGLKALEELGVISPLALTNISKPEIRYLARESGMDFPDQPSRPCLFTRFDYGMRPSLGLLQKLENAEEEIARLGFKNFRLRLFQDDKPLLQVDWPEAQMLEAKKKILQEKLSFLGFPEVRMQAEINLSGYFDQKEKSEEDEELKLLHSLF